MVAYYGDFAEDDTVLIPFNTFDSNDPSASVTVTTLALTDIYVHKDGSVTDIVTDGATVTIDFDGIAGNHLLTIDTSAHADYTTGSEYMVRIEGATVDAGLINAWIGAFSIERAGGALALTKLIQAAVITNAAGVDVAADIIALKAETVLIVADTNELQQDNVPGLISTAQSDLDLITDTDGVILGAAGVDLIWDEVLTGATHNVTNSSGKRLRIIDAAFEVHSGTADAGSTSTTINLETGVADGTTNEIYAGDRCVITAGTGAGEHGLILSYDASTQIATMSKAWVITPDATSEYVLSPADVDIEMWNDNTVTSDGDWAALKAETALIVADTNELQTDWVNAGRLDTLIDTIDTNIDNLNLGILYGTTSGTPSTTSTNTDLSGYADSELVGRVIVFTGGTANGQAAAITSYANTSGVVGFAALTTAPAASDTFKIV